MRIPRRAARAHPAAVRAALSITSHTSKESAMTTKADYTDEEWVRLRRAPFVAGMAISIADPGGPIELTKETLATLKATSSPPSQDELLVSVSQEIHSMVKQKQNPLADFKPD